MSAAAQSPTRPAAAWRVARRAFRRAVPRLVVSGLAGAGVGGLFVLLLAREAGPKAIDFTPGEDVLHLLRMCMAVFAAFGVAAAIVRLIKEHEENAR